MPGTAWLPTCPTLTTRASAEGKGEHPGMIKSRPGKPSRGRRPDSVRGQSRLTVAETLVCTTGPVSALLAALAAQHEVPPWLGAFALTMQCAVSMAANLRRRHRR